MMADDLRPSFGVHAAGHLGPPEVQAGKIPQDRAAHHDVMEMRDHEVSVGEVDVHAHGGQE